MTSKSNRGGQQLPLLKNETGQRLPPKSESRSKRHDRDTNRSRTARRRMDSQLIQVMKQCLKTLKEMAERGDSWGLKNPPLNEIVARPQSLCARYQKEVDLRLADQFVAFAAETERQISRFATERSRFSHELLEALKKEQGKRNQGSRS